MRSGLPGGSAGEESACHAEDLGSSPGSGRSPGKGTAAHSSTDRSVRRQGTEDSGVMRVSPEFAVVTSVIQVHSTAPHSRTDTLSPLRVKIAVFPSATWKGLRRVAWALGCR